MSRYKIEGCQPISGRITASGNKNSALPCIAACLLTDQTVILRNIPDIEDVRVMLNVLSELGCSVESTGPQVYAINAAGLKSHEIPAEKAKKVRASILFAGPMLARLGKVTLPPPGGDVIGRRRLDTHFLALTELGAKIEIDGVFQITGGRLKGGEIFLDEASVTATENAVMACVLCEGRTVIENAASEPHVQDLCIMLNTMGARIEGIGSNILYIEGVKKLSGTDFTVGPDFMEIGSFIGLAAVTKGEIEIDGVNPAHLKMIRLGFGKMGIEWETSGNSILVKKNQSLRVSQDLGGMIPKIDDAPWPGFPPDLTSIMTVVATQVEGTILIHEKMFESRMFFVDKLIGMGARIILCDPHRAVVSGPCKLSGTELVSPDVRAGMAMVIAALCAEGTSIISNVYQIERGYDRLVERLISLGASVTRLRETG
jgi:UDP-N-acetylglucosamine 1-carboxyvinyltransferase